MILITRKTKEYSNKNGKLTKYTIYYLYGLLPIFILKTN